MKILLVDDAATMLEMTRQILLDLGYDNVATATSGNLALEAIADGGFNLMLLDWHMPGLTGMDVVRAVKANDQLKNIYVIMLTAETHPRSIDACLQSGADDYLIKPIKIDVLEEKLKKAQSLIG